MLKKGGGSMRFGLLVSEPSGDVALRQAVEGLLQAQTIPFQGYVTAPASGFSGITREDDFLRRAALALLTPGTPLPASLLLRFLYRDARPGNVLRRYVCLQLSLLPYLRVQHEVQPLSGCQLVGSALLVVPLGTEQTVSAALPDGTWTDLMDGAVYTERLQGIRSLNAMPILVRANTLLPIGVHDRTADADDADRVTLHWFQPEDEAVCRLACGAAYRAFRTPRGFAAESSAEKPWHLIVHQDGEELLIR